MTPLAKTINRFDATARRPLEEAEHHYTSAHFPFARKLLLSMPQVRSYHINRVIGQMDIAGGWQQRPTAWRFVILTFDPSRGLEFDAATTQMIARDHVHFLRRLRCAAVQERVTHDMLSGQTCLRKYLVEIDRYLDDRSVPDSALTALEQALTDQATAADVIRLVRCNRVTTEFAAQPLEEEGQIATDKPLPTTDKLAFVEIYADDDLWGQEFFATPKVLSALRRAPFTVNVYALEERCGLDRRSG